MGMEVGRGSGLVESAEAPEAPRLAKDTQIRTRVIRIRASVLRCSIRFLRDTFSTPFRFRPGLILGDDHRLIINQIGIRINDSQAVGDTAGSAIFAQHLKVKEGGGLADDKAATGGTPE